MGVKKRHCDRDLYRWPLRAGDGKETGARLIIDGKVQILPVNYTAVFYNRMDFL